MGKLISLAGILIVLLAFAIWWDFSFVEAKAASNVSSLDELEYDLQKQILLQKTNITVSYSGDKKELSANIGRLLREAFAADDYIAYIVDSYIYTIRTWGKAASIKISVQYRESAGEKKRVEEKVSAVLFTIIKPSMSQRDKVKAIHDWIVTNVAYDQSLQRYTAFDAVESGQAVCQGYSLLMHRMLETAGIESRIIEGSVSTGSHVWNLVRLGSEWYHLDATWDDPTPDRPGTVSYNYFLKSDKQMRADHHWVKPYPAAKLSG
jgi:transglutaminase/protease-like cytokinesis protein 3